MQVLSCLGAHHLLCICEDLCLLPFKTIVERNKVLFSGRDNLKDGLIDAVKTLRNCKMPDVCQLFGSVANTYHTLQEWCAPRILIDGTEAYSAMPQWSLTEANNVFLDPDIVHLLRNPRECFSNAQVSCDIVELEQQWVKFTKYMLQLEGTDVLEIRHEDLKSAVCAITSCLSIPAYDLVLDDA